MGCVGLFSFFYQIFYGFRCGHPFLRLEYRNSLFFRFAFAHNPLFGPFYSYGFLLGRSFGRCNYINAYEMGVIITTLIYSRRLISVPISAGLISVSHVTGVGSPADTIESCCIGVSTMDLEILLGATGSLGAFTSS